jgi:carboxymethylenebutenolidase
LQFGDQDASIPMTDIELIKEKRPDVEVYVYKGAGHGFACDERGSYNEAATKEALGRTLAWLTKYVG